MVGMAPGAGRRPKLAAGSCGRWKMQDAKAQFSLVARRAREEGPQRVTHRGRDAVVVLAADEYDRLVGKVAKRPSLVELLQNSPLRDLDFEFEGVRSPVREPEF